MVVMTTGKEVNTTMVRVRMDLWHMLLNNPDNFHYFIGTLQENEWNDIECGTLVYTDGRKRRI